MRGAESLREESASDYLMRDTSAEDLLGAIIDCTIALACRTGKSPRTVLEDVWKSIGSDEKWRLLMGISEGEVADT